MKTREEVEALKNEWLQDPCWDIDDTEGFEDYRDELAAYQAEVEAAKDAEYNARINAKAAMLGCSPAVAAVIESLERRIAALEQNAR